MYVCKMVVFVRNIVGNLIYVNVVKWNKELIFVNWLLEMSIKKGNNMRKG